MKNGDHDQPFALFTGIIELASLFSARPKRYGPCRRLKHHVTMLSEAEGAPHRPGRSRPRSKQTAASNPEWERAVLASTSMRGVEVKHVRREDVDL